MLEHDVNDNNNPIYFINTKSKWVPIFSDTCQFERIVPTDSDRIGISIESEQSIPGVDPTAIIFDLESAQIVNKFENSQNLQLSMDGGWASVYDKDEKQILYTHTQS